MKSLFVARHYALTALRFIAIMLGRLQMTIEDALKNYKKFMGTVFPTSRWTTVSLVKSGSKWDASELEKCIKQLVQEQLGQDPDQVLLLDEESAKTCKVYVSFTISYRSD
jgi:hypothetical protein